MRLTRFRSCVIKTANSLTSLFNPDSTSLSWLNLCGCRSVSDWNCYRFIRASAQHGAISAFSASVRLPAAGARVVFFWLCISPVLRAGKAELSSCLPEIQLQRLAQDHQDHQDCPIKQSLGEARCRDVQPRGPRRSYGGSCQAAPNCTCPVVSAVETLCEAPYDIEL